jgi:hypothetical protein
VGGQYPAAPLANDVVLPQTRCAAGVDDFVMQAVTGDILYRCFAGGAYYDLAGVERVAAGYDQVHAWNENGLLLAERATLPVLLDAAGAEIPLPGAPSVRIPGQSPVVRVRGNGFWYLAGSGWAGMAVTRWRVSASGEAGQDAQFGPAGPGADVRFTALDDDGSAYGVSFEAGTTMFVYKCPVTDSCWRAYSTADASMTPPPWWATPDDGRLVTRP